MTQFHGIARNCDDVVLVKPLPDFQIYVVAADGRKGIFDLRRYLQYGALEELRDVSYFTQVGILSGAVTWPNGQDIAPQTLWAEMVVCPSEVGQDSPIQGDAQDSTEGQMLGERSV